MRSKVTVVLLFLNVVLFFYIFYFEQRWHDERQLLEARRRVLPTEIASMDSFTRSSSTGEVVRLEKRGETWWLTEPYEWLANPNAISRIHNELQFLEHETSFAVADLGKSGQTLADYGLADPALTLKFTAGEKSYELLIGDATEVGKRLYVLSPDGNRIHVVSRSLAESVGLTLAELRADSIFTIPGFEVRSLNIQSAAPTNLKVRLRRDAASRWKFESPILARAAKNTVEVTINSLNALSAIDFLNPHDPDLNRTGLNSPVLRVTLEGNARRETLLLGTATPKDGVYYAKIEDKSIVFTTAVPALLLEDLQSSQEKLRDPHVADFAPESVTALTIAAPGQPEISLKKLEPTATSPDQTLPPEASNRDRWQIVTRSTGQAPIAFAADTPLVSGLIENIHLLAARKFLSDAPSATDIENYGFNRPEREITLSLNTGGGPRGNEPSTLVLQIGVSPNQPGKAFARLTNPPFLYEILPDIIEESLPQALHYRQRLLRKLPTDAAITNLALIELATGQTLFNVERKDGDKDWTAALSVEPEARRKALKGILDELSLLRAQQFTADTFIPTHVETASGSQPWRYRLDYSISFNGGGAAQSTPSSLMLTERLGGMTMLAGTADFGGVVFRVSQELLDALFQLSYSQTGTPDPGAATATPTTEPGKIP